MANTIKLKNSGTASNTPSALEYGELAINYADGKIFYKNGSGSIVQFSAPTVSATNYVVNGKLASDFTVTAGSDQLLPFVDDFDPNSWWDPTAKKFQPTIAGYYNIAVSVWWAVGVTNTNQYNTQMRKNGSTFAIFQNPVNTTSGMTQGGSKLVYLNGSTDYVDITVYNGDGANRTVQYGGSAGNGTYFSAALMTAGKGDKGDTGETGATGATGASGATTLDGLTDVTSPSPSSGDFLKYNGSAWVNDAIDLATDTTGSYVASLVAGTGITLTNNSGEGSTPTIALSNSSVTINGQSISLGGTGTITAAAGTLTGTTLNSTVVSSSLTSVGTLSSLTVTNNVTAAQYYGRARDTEIRFFMEVI